MTDPAVEAVARAIWDAEERVHSPSDPMPWEEGSTLSHVPYLRSAQAAIAAHREQGGGPIPAGWVTVPREPTDEIMRASLATEFPAIYRTHLRHPDDGPGSAKETEGRIVRERKRWAAQIAVAPQPDPLGRALLKEDGK